jgi:hypothetical protein
MYRYKYKCILPSVADNGIVLNRMMDDGCEIDFNGAKESDSLALYYGRWSMVSPFIFVVPGSPSSKK